MCNVDYFIRELLVPFLLFDMTRSLTQDLTRNLLYSKSALYHWDIKEAANV